MFSRLTENANYTSTPNNFTVKEPADYLCSDFPKNPLVWHTKIRCEISISLFAMKRRMFGDASSIAFQTVGMSPYYDFLQQPFNFMTAGNLSFVLRKMFYILTTSADEKQQVIV